MSLPEAYQKEIQALDYKVLESQPKDILQFCADFFLSRLAAERLALLSPTSTKKPPETEDEPPEGFADLQAPKPTMAPGGFKMPFPGSLNPFGGKGDKADAGASKAAKKDVIEEEENDTVASPTTPSFGNTASGGPASFRPPFGGDLADDAPPGPLRSPPNPDTYPAQYNFGRRTSVSAESLKPMQDGDDNWTPPFHKKTPEQLERLKAAIEKNFLFSHLDEEQSAQVLGALIEKPIPAKDIKVISQGDAGDYFYVVEKGSFDVYVNDKGSLQPGPDGMGKLVGKIEAGGSFGELALMYNAPRAATVVSAEPNCTLWALDRVTFRRILMESTFARRRMYEGFLEEVPLLASLTPYERSKIADALETRKFSAGDTIIKEGDVGDAFYLLESGEAEAYKSGVSEPVMHYTKGDFFGELALLNDAPRAASVICKTDVKVASLGKRAFQRLLGPVEGIMRRTRYVGVESGVEDVDPLATQH